MAHTPQPDGTENSSELFVAMPLGAPATTEVEAQTAASAPTSASPASPATIPSALRTVELYFVDPLRRRVSFKDAVRHRGDGWRVRNHVTPVLGLRPSEGAGLGGTPGRGGEFYRGRRASDYGLDAELVVLYWDDDERRAYAADETLLQSVLGRSWREQLRELCSGRLESGQG